MVVFEIAQRFSKAKNNKVVAEEGRLCSLCDVRDVEDIFHFMAVCISLEK